jgi:hypothetical protein
MDWAAWENMPSSTSMGCSDVGSCSRLPQHFEAQSVNLAKMSAVSCHKRSGKRNGHRRNPQIILVNLAISERLTSIWESGNLGP